MTSQSNSEFRTSSPLTSLRAKNQSFGKTLNNQKGSRIIRSGTTLDSVDESVDISYVNQAFHDELFRAELLAGNAKFFRGGNTIMSPQCIQAVLGDTIDSLGEARIEVIVDRGCLPCGAPVCLVKCRNVLTGVLTDHYVVPEGTMVEGYKSKGDGHYEVKFDSECIMKSRFVSFSVEAGKPSFPSQGMLRTIRYNMRVFKYDIAKWWSGVDPVETIIRLDFKLFQYLYAQRLGTSSSLTTSSVSRIIHSAAIKNSGGTVTPNTIKTTTDYFVTNNAEPLKQEKADNCLIIDLTEFPNLAEPDFAIIHVGQGPFISSESSTIVNVVDSGNLTVKSAKGVTFKDGLIEFTTPYREPEPLYMYGPRVASAAVVYSTKSTNNLHDAFKRLSNSRAPKGEFSEIIYRFNADCLVMTLLNYPDNVHPNVRAYAKAFKAFGAWGLSHNKLAKYKSALSSSRQAHLILTSKIFLEYISSLHSLSVTPNPVNVSVALLNPDHITFGSFTPVVPPPVLGNQGDKFEYDPEVTEINSLNEVELKCEFASREMAKREERMTHFQEMVSHPWQFDPLFWSKSVKGKVKWETAKYGKLSRLFISLGCKRTLFAPRIPEYVKGLMNQNVVLEDIVGFRTNVRFFKTPTQTDMNHWSFDCFASGSNREAFINYHSDDSHMSIPLTLSGVQGQLHLCLDIAKCDLSHSPGLFVVAASFCASLGFDPNVVMELFQQLQSDIQISHPDPKVDEYIMFQIEYIMLLTGSTLTTFINNIGSLFILFSVLAGLKSKNCNYLTLNELESDVLSFAGYAGYEITLDACVFIPNTMVEPKEIESRLCQVTFLKYFPAIALCGTPVAIKDYSTLLRGLGVSDEPVECLTRLQEIVEGWKFSVKDPLLECVFEEVGLPPPSNQYTCDGDAVSSRYGCPISELVEGFRLLFSMRDAVLVKHPALSLVLKKGYDLPALRSDVDNDQLYSGKETGTFGLGVR